MPYAANVSVTSPVSAAIELVKRQLFRPFNIEKWFTVGVCAWLAYLGETGFSFNLNLPGDRRKSTGGPDFREMVDAAHAFVMRNLGWIVPLAIFLFVCLIAASVLLLWLKSRGDFMFLHCVAYDKAEIELSWKKYRKLAQSLFGFRIVLLVLGWVSVVPILIWAGLAAWKMYRVDDFTREGIVTLVLLGIVWLAFCILFGIVVKLLKDFVVPVMFLRGKNCMAAWDEFLGLLGDNAGHFVVYLLFQIVLMIAIGVIVLATILCTCCIAGCLMMIPYLGTVVLLPVLTFKRAYSLIYLAQFGPEYNVFPPAMPPAITPA